MQVISCTVSRNQTERLFLKHALHHKVSVPRVKNSMSPVIVACNMMCEDGIVKLSKLNSFLCLTYRAYCQFSVSFEVPGLKIHSLLLSHPCGATKPQDLKSLPSALPTAITLVSNSLKNLIFHEKSFYFTYVLPLLVCEVSYIRCAVDELVLFSATFYKAFQVTNINQLFKF